MFLSRADWGAAPPNWTSAGWAPGQPTSYTLHYEGSNVPVDYTRQQYTQIVDAIQAYHQSHGYNDIAYNFVVSPIGDIYEAHGWDTRSAAQADPGNALSLAICYIGGPETPWTDAAKGAFLWLMAQGGQMPVYPHSKWVPTACCGDIGREWIAAGCPSPNPVPTPEPEEEDMRYPYSVVRVIEDARVFQVGQGRVYLPSEDSIRLLVDLGLVEPGDGPGGAKVLERPKVYVEQLPEVA